MQLAAAGYLKRISGIRLFHAHSNVRFDLLKQAVAQVAGGDIFALAARKRGIVDHEHHRNGRLVDLDERQRLHVLRVAGGLTDVEVCHAGNGHDVAELCALCVHALEALKLVELRNARVALFVACAAADGNGLADLYGAALHTADTDTTDVLIIVNVGEQHLRRAVKVTLRRRNIVYNGFKQRLHVRALFVRLVHGVAVTCGSVDHREIELVFVCTELNEEVKHFVHDFKRTCARTVDLIDDNDRLFAKTKRLL